MDGDERSRTGDARPADAEQATDPGESEHTEAAGSGDRPAVVGGVPLDAVPADADEEEAAAIAVALSTYLAERRAEGEEDETAEAWHGRRWAFAGRMHGLTGRAVRIPTRAPTDDWTAADRADRL